MFYQRRFLSLGDVADW